MDEVTCVKCRQSVARNTTWGSPEGPVCRFCQNLAVGPALHLAPPKPADEPEGNLLLGFVGGVTAPLGFLLVRWFVPGRQTLLGARIGVLVAVGTGIVLVATGVLR